MYGWNEVITSQFLLLAMQFASLPDLFLVVAVIRKKPSDVKADNSQKVF